MIRRYKNELKLLLLLTVAALLAVPLYRKLTGPRPDKYYLVINDASGINPENASVVIKGLRVGKTEKAALYHNNVLLTISISKGTRLPKPALVRPGGFPLYGLSASVIHIEPDSNAATYYKPGDTLYNLQFVRTDTAYMRKQDSINTRMTVDFVKGLIQLLKPSKNADSIK